MSNSKGVDHVASGDAMMGPLGTLAGFPVNMGSVPSLQAVEHYAAKRGEVRSRRSAEQEAICTQITRIYSKQL